VEESNYIVTLLNFCTVNEMQSKSEAAVPRIYDGSSKATIICDTDSASSQCGRAQFKTIRSR
jgi:hypothetical protein